MVCQPPLLSDTELYSLVDVLRLRSQHQPKQLAYTFLVDGETEEIHLTYAELDRQAQAVAAQLQMLTSPGERALLLYPQGLDFIAAFFGCLYAGIVAVPVYPPPRRNQKMSRLQALAMDADATIALTTIDVLSTLRQRLDYSSDLDRFQWLTTDQIPSSLAAAWQPPLVQSSTQAFLQYTLQTGTPKGVIVSHGSSLQTSEIIKQTFTLSSDSVSVTWLPRFHDMGLFDSIIQPMYTGFRSVLLPSAAFMQKPWRWLKAISHYGATYGGAPNFGYELCTQRVTPAQRQALDLSRWTIAYSGVELVHKPTLEKFAATFANCGFRPKFFHIYYGKAADRLMIAAVATQRVGSIETTELKKHRTFATDNNQNVAHSHPDRPHNIIIRWDRQYYSQDIEATVFQSHEALNAEGGAALSLDIDGIERLILVQEMKQCCLQCFDPDKVACRIRQTVYQQHNLLVYGVVLVQAGSLPRTSEGKIQRLACYQDFMANNLTVVYKWMHGPDTSQADLTLLRKDINILEKNILSRNRLE